MYPAAKARHIDGYIPLDSAGGSGSSVGHAVICVRLWGTVWPRMKSPGEFQARWAAATAAEDRFFDQNDAKALQQALNIWQELVQIAEYIGLVMWGLSADVAGRTLSNLQGSRQSLTAI